MNNTMYKSQKDGIIKLQNAGSVPQVDNTRVSKPLVEYQKSTVEQDHDALVKRNLEHPNDKVYRIEDLIQKEKEANPSWVKRAGNLAVNPIPTSNFGMMTVPNPDNPIRSTVKDELGVAMAAASVPMLGSEIGIYGGLGAGLRFGAGSAAAAGASYAGGKAGDWLDNKLGANWIGDTNRLVLPFITFPAGMKGANSILRSAAGHGITMGMPQETLGALRGQYFNNRFVNTGNRYFGTNFNKLYKQAISDVYGYDKFIKDNINVSPIQATSKDKISRLIHWDENSTGAPTDPIKHVHWEDGKITPAKTKIYVKGEPGVAFTVVEGDQHPIFWGGNKAWWEGPNGNTLDQHFGSIELFKKRYPIQLPDLKQNFVQTNPTTKNGRFLIIDNPDQQLFRFNHYTGSTTGAISPSTLTDAFEYNPLTKTWARVKYTAPSKQTRVIPEGTYPLYTGPKHSIIEVVNPDGTVNPRAALRIEREVADNIPGAYRMEARLENPEWHKSDPTTWEHTKNVAQSAWTIPTPKGITKQDQMIAALGHDFGKIVSGDGHAQSSAALIEQIFPDVTESQLTAIAEHMGEPKSILGKVTKQADILNGQSAIIRTVQPNGKIRLSLPSHTDIQPRQFVLDPQGNNKFYVHMRTWDGDHIPANLSPEDKTTLFNALYEELPEGAEILFPQSGPGNYATRGTVAGLQRLARDSRFRPGDKGILEYVDKDGSIKTFEGTSFIKNILSKKQGGRVKKQSDIPESAKAKSYFAGLKDYILHKTKSFIPSQYKPTKGNNIQVQYYTRPGLKEEVALNLFGGTDKNAKNFLGDSNYFYKDFDEAYQDLSKEYIANSSRTASNGTLGEYGVSAGMDDNGRYISFIDNFDHVFIPGKGIPIYDRIYENEINSVYNKNRSAFDEGDWITRSPVLQKLKKKQTK